MKKMQCEICGCSELCKEDGMFVCQECGAKYTPEEARNLLKEVDDASQPSTTTSSSKKKSPAAAPVATVTSEERGKYAELYKRAYESANYQETEHYCNHVLEDDPNNAEALLYKGAAAAWQSTFAKLRTKECLTAWKAAFDLFASDKEKKVALSFTDKEVVRLASALFSIAASFADTGVNENNYPTLRAAVDSVAMFVYEYRDYIHKDYDVESIMDAAATTLLLHIHNGANSVESRFHDQKPTTPTVNTSYHKMVLYHSIVCGNFGDDHYFTEDARIKFFETALYSFPEQANQMGVYLWFNGGPVHRSMNYSYTGTFNSSYKPRLEAVTKERDRRATALFWQTYSKEKAQAEEEVADLTKRLNAIPDRQEAVETVRILEERIETLRIFLRKQHTEKVLSDADNLMLSERERIIAVLDGAGEYDDYLNKYPVVKRGRSLVNNADQYLSKFAVPAKKVSKIVWILSPILLVASAGIIALALLVIESTFMVVLGALIAIGTLLAFGGEVRSVLKSSKERKEQMAAFCRLKPLVDEICKQPIYEKDRLKVLERKAIELIGYGIEKVNDQEIIIRVQAKVSYVQSLMDSSNAPKDKVENLLGEIEELLPNSSK